MVSALNGVAANVCVFGQSDLLGTPVKLLLSPQECQGVPFSPICQNITFAAAPLVLTPVVRKQGRHRNDCKQLYSDSHSSRHVDMLGVLKGLNRIEEMPVSVKIALFVREPWPCDPAAETEIQHQIRCLQS